MYSRSYESQHANGYSAGTDPAEHCEPPAYDCSSSSSFDSRSQLASLDKHEATILKPCASAWEIAPEDETAGAPSCEVRSVADCPDDRVSMSRASTRAVGSRYQRDHSCTTRQAGRRRGPMGRRHWQAYGRRDETTRYMPSALNSIRLVRTVRFLARPTHSALLATIVARLRRPLRIARVSQKAR